MFIDVSPPRPAVTALPPGFDHASIALDRWQYRLTASPHPDARRCGAFWLSVGPDLPVIPVFDRTGSAAGVLLGFPVDLHRGTPIEDVWNAPETANLNTDDGIKAALLALGGLFIWVCLTSSCSRIYPDAGTQVSCVWDAKSQSVGATALSILDEDAYDARFNAMAFKTLGINGEGFFPAGMTAHTDVIRLLPNHMLDLSDWTAHRFEVDPFEAPPTTDIIVDIMIETIQDHISALMQGPKDVAVALTAGYESRALLACARQWLDQITFVTVSGDDRHRTDTVMAQRIATDLGLRHIALPRIEADLDAQNTFLKRGGHCNGDSNMQFHSSIEPIAVSHVFIGGFGGEIGRAFYWSDTDTSETEVSANNLMARMGLKPEPSAILRMQDWCDALRGRNAREILDLAYLEHRVGPWAMAQFCADPTLVRYAPMITYRTVACMQALPDDWKRQDTLNATIIDRLWPALNAYPVNSLGFWPDTFHLINRLKTNPALIAKKFRQILS